MEVIVEFSGSYRSDGVLYGADEVRQSTGRNGRSNKDVGCLPTCFRCGGAVDRVGMGVGPKQGDVSCEECRQGYGMVYVE